MINEGCLTQKVAYVNKNDARDTLENVNRPFQLSSGCNYPGDLITLQRFSKREIILKTRKKHFFLDSLLRKAACLIYLRYPMILCISHRESSFNRTWRTLIFRSPGVRLILLLHSTRSINLLGLID